MRRERRPREREERRPILRRQLTIRDGTAPRGGWCTRGTAARTRAAGRARAETSAGTGSTHAPRARARPPPPRRPRRSRRPRLDRPSPSGPSMPPAAPTSTLPRAPTRPRGATPRAPLRGDAPRPSPLAPPPARSVSVAPGSHRMPPAAPWPAGDPRRRRDTASGIHPTQPVHGRHAVHGQHITGDAGRDLVLLDEGHHFVERAGHDRLESPVHSIFVPEVTPAVLHPLEVADGHPARVREDVGN